MRRAALITVLCLTGSSAARGQATQPQGRACFRGQPLPACRSFWITEASYLALFGHRGDFSGTRFSRWSASLDLGHMWNVGPKVAVGGGVSASVVDGVNFTVRPRLRYWLSPKSSLDVAPGLMVAGAPGTPRPAVDLSVMTRDRVGLTLQSYLMQSYSFGNDGQYTTRKRLVTYGGVRLGSKLGVAGAAADGVAFLTALALYLIACGNNGCD